MGRLHITRGMRFLLDEQVYRVTSVLLEGRYQLENLSFGGQLILSQTEIAEAWATSRLRFEVIGQDTYMNDVPLTTNYTQADFQTLPEAQRDKAWQRYNWLHQVLAYYEYHGWQHLTRRQLKVFVDQLEESAPSVASLERWLKAFLESSGDIRSLVPQTQRQGGLGQTRLKASVEQIIIDVLESCAREPRHRTPDQVYTHILNRLADENRFRDANDQLEPPSRATLYRRLQSAGIQNVIRRSASRSERQRAGDIDGSVSVSRILERVEIDHTPLHLFVVDFEDRLPIGRPTLTLATDSYSKMPFGFDVSFHPGSYLTVMRCLRHGILPKPDVQDLYKTVNPFPVYGLPETIIVDRGKEFIGQSLTDALGMLGIIHEVMPGRTPWYKGSIERFFRTQNQGLLEGLPGYTFGNIFSRGDYDPVKDACISLSAFRELLHIFLLDIYAQRWHEGIQDIPAKRWRVSLQTGLQPCLYHDAEELRIILCASEERVLTRQGIAWETLFYHSSDLAQLRAVVGGERVRFRYDPDDLGEIYLFDQVQSRWLTVPAVNQAYARGLSLYKHRVIRQAVLAEKRKVDIFALAEAKARLQDLVAREFALTRKTRGRKQAMRFLDGVQPSVMSKMSPVAWELPEDTPLPDTTDWYGDYELPSTAEGQDDDGA